ncbi:c-type cytochrome [Blattabacterium cuenoti]|uniref:c-type cytochrome n=1 Tax=Blattabacterium cuenoti TaxID=1653831 RepID=UPI00163BDCEE|nr:c-type cytochrome [Blattabacterium cuenoti]
MKKILFFISIFYCSLIFSIKSENIKGDANVGADLFKKNCTACHSMELEKKMIGPALSGITKKRSREWLHKWIINNKSLRESGDKDAIAIYKEYGNIEMNLFPKLSEKQVDDILFFIQNPKIEKNKNNHNKKNENEITEEKQLKKFLIKLIIFCFVILSLILLWILYRIQILTSLLSETKSPVFKKRDFAIFFLYKKILKNKKIRWRLLFYFVSFLLFLTVYGTWNFLMKIDVNKGYKPKQPIHFSHKIHSDINKIDCQYCHSSAKYSKVSGIPSANVCMNCHITIDKYQGDYLEEGKSRDEYDKEIKKIYHVVGWDPENRKYSGNTHPVQWIRIHNMPDFVYFDHSQHIVSGEKMIKKFKKVDLVCKACHGDVQKMDQVEMSNDFTMEWCISCHRNVEIDTNNQYYKNYFSNNIKKEKKITVDMVGGTECAKCHY